MDIQNINKFIFSFVIWHHMLRWISYVNTHAHIDTDTFFARLRTANAWKGTIIVWCIFIFLIFSQTLFHSLLHHLFDPLFGFFFIFLFWKFMDFPYFALVAGINDGNYDESFHSVGVPAREKASEWTGCVQYVQKIGQNVWELSRCFYKIDLSINLKTVCVFCLGEKVDQKERILNGLETLTWVLRQIVAKWPRRKWN